MQVYNNELYHHGVLGMKWGNKKLGINNKGNISLVEKTNKKDVKKFVLKLLISMSVISLAAYLRKHPKVVLKGADIVSGILKKDKLKTVESIAKDSYIFSKELGRFLTVEETMSKGFM